MVGTYTPSKVRSEMTERTCSPGLVGTWSGYGRALEGGDRGVDEPVGGRLVFGVLGAVGAVADAVPVAPGHDHPGFEEGFVDGVPPVAVAAEAVVGVAVPDLGEQGEQELADGVALAVAAGRQGKDPLGAVPGDGEGAGGLVAGFDPAGDVAGAVAAGADVGVELVEAAVEEVIGERTGEGGVELGHGRQSRSRGGFGVGSPGFAVG